MRIRFLTGRRRLQGAAIGSLGLAVALLSGCGYNTIQTLDESAAGAQHNIEAQLQRRSDLIGNLVETVKGQSKQELTVFNDVARARSGLDSAIQSHDPSRMADANLSLTSQVTIMNRSVTEAYPTIHSNEAYMRLMDELTGTENRIAVARTDYNQAAQTYNAYIRQFPANMTAHFTHAQPRTYFSATAAADTAPKVDFSH